MKILYAVQATGNGHLSRCMEFYPALSKYAEVDVFLSGIQGDLNLPFDVRYKKHGLSYIFGKDGGVDYLKTAFSLRPFRFLVDVLKLNLKEYDLVVNDFEPVTAWACKFAKKECIALSHQAAFLSKKVPRPKHNNLFANFVFNYFAPSSRSIGLHYKSYDQNIFTPVVRSDIRQVVPDYRDNHVLVYLPAYEERVLIDKFLHFPHIHWKVFSKHTKVSQTVKNVEVFPVGKNKWLYSMKICPYAIIGAGFESSSEMLFLGKKIMVLPMPNQYEQLCNAVALKEMGVTIVKSINDSFLSEIRSWLSQPIPEALNYTGQTDFLARLALGLIK